MTQSGPISIAERFTQIIRRWITAINAPASSRPATKDTPPLPAPLMRLIRLRADWMSARLSALARRLRLGLMLSRRARVSRPVHPAPAGPAHSLAESLPPRGWPGSGSLPRLPRYFGWLPHYLPEAEPYVAELQALLADPEMIALVEAEPATKRALRPLCHMMGIKAPPCLAPTRAAPRKHSARSRKRQAPDAAPESPARTVWVEIGAPGDRPNPA